MRVGVRCVLPRRKPPRSFRIQCRWMDGRVGCNQHGVSSGNASAVKGPRDAVGWRRVKLELCGCNPHACSLGHLVHRRGFVAAS